MTPPRRWPFFPLPLALLLPLLLAACSSVRATAIPSGPRAAPRNGPVAIYTLDPPAAARALGAVEVRAQGAEANVETLLPVFVDRVAALGGDSAMIDAIETRFPIVMVDRAETYSVPCGLSAMCVGTRMVPAAEEFRIVVLRGRALLSSPPSGRAP